MCTHYLRFKNWTRDIAAIIVHGIIRCDFETFKTSQLSVEVRQRHHSWKYNVHCNLFRLRPTAHESWNCRPLFPIFPRGWKMGLEMQNAVWWPNSVSNLSEIWMPIYVVKKDRLKTMSMSCNLTIIRRNQDQGKKQYCRKCQIFWVLVVS